MMDTLGEYKEFWLDIRSKIMTMRSLSSIWQEHRDTRVSYQYSIEPTVPEELIAQFEEKNKIELPLSYRSYLLYFGGSGPSDFGHTNSFVDKVSHEDVSEPSSLEIFEDIQDIDPEDGPHPIASGKGTVEIAIGFNPTIPYLVLNGEARGYVYWWYYNDMIGGAGEFALWYKRWADKALANAEKKHTIFSTPIGMSQQALWEQYPEELQHKERDGVAYAYHKETEAAFLFDANDCVKGIHICAEYFRQRHLDKKQTN